MVRGYQTSLEHAKRRTEFARPHLPTFLTIAARHKSLSCLIPRSDDNTSRQTALKVLLGVYFGGVDNKSNSSYSIDTLAASENRNAAFDKSGEKAIYMTLVSFVTQFWVLLLSFAVMVAVLAIAIGVRAAWREKQEQPMEMDQEHRARLEQRLLEISASRRKTA